MAYGDPLNGMEIPVTDLYGVRTEIITAYQYWTLMRGSEGRRRMDQNRRLFEQSQREKEQA